MTSKSLFLISTVTDRYVCVDFFVLYALRQCFENLNVEMNEVE